MGLDTHMVLETVPVPCSPRRTAHHCINRSSRHYAVALPATRTFDEGSDGLVLGLVHNMFTAGNEDTASLMQYVDMSSAFYPDIQRYYMKKIGELILTMAHVAELQGAADAAGGRSKARDALRAAEKRGVGVPEAQAAVDKAEAASKGSSAKARASVLGTTGNWTFTSLHHAGDQAIIGAHQILSGEKTPEQVLPMEGKRGHFYRAIGRYSRCSLTGLPTSYKRRKSCRCRSGSTSLPYDGRAPGASHRQSL